MYAIIEVSGKQYKVEKDSVINVGKLDEDNESITIDKVLLLSKEDEVMVGEPYLSNVKVEAKLLGLVKGKKVRGIKFKKRKNYTRTLGHRTEYTQLKIDNLVVS